MNKAIFCLLITCFCWLQSSAQRSFDFIITIDENIVASSLSEIKLIAVSQDGGKQEIDVTYHPGNLSMAESEYIKILDTKIKTVYLVFYNTNLDKEKQRSYHYEIDLKKGWLQHRYYVLHIYNTTKKKYKKLFHFSKGKAYVYEFDYPGGSVKLIRKKSGER